MIKVLTCDQTSDSCNHHKNELSHFGSLIWILAQRYKKSFFVLFVSQVTGCCRMSGVMSLLVEMDIYSISEGRRQMTWCVCIVLCVGHKECWKRGGDSDRASATKNDHVKKKLWKNVQTVPNIQLTRPLLNRRTLCCLFVLIDFSTFFFFKLVYCFAK